MVSTFTRTFNNSDEVVDSCDQYLANSHEITLNGTEVRVQCECDGVSIVCETGELAEKLMSAFVHRAEELADY